MSTIDNKTRELVHDAIDDAFKNGESFTDAAIAALQAAGWVSSDEHRESLCVMYVKGGMDQARHHKADYGDSPVAIELRRRLDAEAEELHALCCALPYEVTEEDGTIWRLAELPQRTSALYALIASPLPIKCIKLRQGPPCPTWRQSLRKYSPDKRCWEAVT